MNSKEIISIVLMVIILIVIGTVSFFVTPSSQETSQSEQKIEIMPEAKVAEPEKWEWIDEGAIIAVEFPSEWGLRWGPGYYHFLQTAGGEAFTWSITLKENGPMVKGLAIDKMGINFPDRRVGTEEAIEVNGMPAIKVEVVSDTNPNLKEVAILIDGKSVDRPETLVVISNHGNNYKFFERFYKSFKLKTPQSGEKTQADATSAVRETAPQVKPASATASGDLKVVYLGNNTYQFSGTINPPSPCSGNELIQFKLDYGNGQEKSYSVADCNTQTFLETASLPVSPIPVFPELLMRQVDSGTSVWTNYLQTRYKIDTANKQPIIQKL